MNSYDVTRLAQDNQSLPKFQYAYDASEYFMGEIIIGAHAIKDEFKLEFPEGTAMNFRYYMEPEKKKKAFKSIKNMERSMNIKLVGPNGEFARVKEEQEKIFVPLIVHGMLRL